MKWTVGKTYFRNDGVKARFISEVKNNFTPLVFAVEISGAEVVHMYKADGSYPHSASSYRKFDILSGEPTDEEVSLIAQLRSIANGKDSDEEVLAAIRQLRNPIAGPA